MGPAVAGHPLTMDWALSQPYLQLKTSTLEVCENEPKDIKLEVDKS